MTDIIYGQLPCEVRSCRYRAYVQVQGLYLCTRHGTNLAKINHWDIKHLEKSPELLKNLRKKQLAVHEKECYDSARLRKTKGHVKCLRIFNRVLCPLEKNYLNLLPNARGRSGNRGITKRTLSPMVIGPVDTERIKLDRHLPSPRLVENFHQGSKVTSDEIDADGKVKPDFFKNQLEWYEKYVPQRHKVKKGEDGKRPCIHRVNDEFCVFTYGESRKFYCMALEHAFDTNAECIKALDEIRTLIEQGVNINICGYDAQNIDASKIDEAYFNFELPFGHELVILAYLSREKEKRPWNTHVVQGRPLGPNMEIPDLSEDGNAFFTIE